MKNIKKILCCLLFLFVFALFVGCESDMSNPSENETLSDTSNTTENTQISASSNKKGIVEVELDISSDSETGKNMVKGEYVPYLSPSPLTYTPDYETDNTDSDIEITFENDCDCEFCSMGDGTICMLSKNFTCKLVSKTGNTFHQIGSAYIERYNENLFGGRGGWGRLPYVNQEENKNGLIEYDGEGTYTFDIRENTYSEIYFYGGFAADQYRLVFYLDDGVHYKEFFIATQLE